MKSIGEVGIVYFDTPPESCLLLPVTITEAQYPELFAKANEQMSRGNTLFVASGNDIFIKSPQFLVTRVQGDADFGTLGYQSGARTVALTVANMARHTHIQNAHTHTQNAHTHTQTAHTHTQVAHNHTQSPHTHNMRMSNTTQAHQPMDSTGVEHITSNYLNLTSHQSTAGNHAFTASNHAFTATNQNTTAVNQNFTAVNQNTGNGTAHSNLPPYTVVNFWICYQE